MTGGRATMDSVSLDFLNIDLPLLHELTGIPQFGLT